jgi:cytochrome bd-type quinol oxidase subunit 2
VSTLARTYLLCFGVLYTGLSLLFVVMGQRTFFYPNDSKLRTSARRYRFRMYAYWAARLGIGCVVLAYGIFGPLAKKTMILLALPVALCWVLGLLAILIWRKDYRVLREAGLLKY